MRKNRLLKTAFLIITINLILLNYNYEVKAKEQMNFKNITIEEGLTQGTVEALFQDSKGYIWIGTNDGLNRYNGYQFKVYRVEEDNKNSLVNNYILDIKEDKYGNIWVATANGLSKIHNDGQKITNYLDDAEKGNLSHANVASILITSDDKILIGTADGLNIYDEDKDSFKRIFEGDKLTEQYINSLVEDSQKNIWIATENGISKINLETGSSKNFLYDSNDENTISENNIYKVYYDTDGYIWAGTYDSGACKIDINTDEITRYYCKQDDKSIGGNFVKNFLKDSKGHIWVCTDGGLSKLNNDGSFTTYKNKLYDKDSLIDDNIFSIIQDRTGLIWLGTYSGISIFNPDRKISHYKNDPFDSKTISDNMVTALYEDEQGLLWIGSKNKGIDLLNRETDRIDNLRKNDLIDIIPSDCIYDITGNGNKICIATDKGVAIIDKESKTSKMYDENNGLTNNVVKSIYYDSLGYLWIGTPTGLSILNLETDEIIDITEIIKEYSPSDQYIGDIYKDSDGEYFIATFVQGGLIRINPRTKEIKAYRNEEKNKNSLSNNSVRTIAEGFRGEIWIGTSLGLNKFNKDTEEFERYTTKDGIANANIYGILVDKYGNPWVSTNMGISKINRSNGKVINLDITDGLQSNEFNGKAYFKNKKDEFIFGGINGFNIFNPEDIKETQYTYGITFDEFKVNGVNIDSLDSKKLKYDENNIFIEAFLPNYINPKAIQYYYLLEGANDDWTAMETNSITLSNLSPGDYVFNIRARNNNGVISESTSVAFTISPPFWASKYSVFLYIFIVIITFLNHKYKVKKLDELVDQRTNALSEEMKRNNDLFKKVIDLEKSKNNYLINMSHELRTPLNVIYSTEQLIRELNKGDLGIEKDKLNKYMGIMRNNTKRLLKIINDLIDSSKIEHGSYRIDIKEVDIVYLVEEAALSLREYIEDKGINLIIDPEIEEKIIEVDENEIERCIVNIVSNAAKFTNIGGNIEVTIKDLNNHVKIEIIDDGIGIDKDHHELIFNRFNQVVDKNAEVKGGSGLGLTITKKIIELHEGEIYVESEVGKGSKFVIILPIKQKRNKMD